MQEELGFYLNFARFHPLIVHMPIGVLFFALAMEGVKRFFKRSDLDFAIGMALGFGVLTSIFAAFTGWLLSQEGGYDSNALDWHMWMGFGLSFLTIVAFVLFVFRDRFGHLQALSLILINGFLAVTGHLGGNMTHGEDYLFTKSQEGSVLIADISSADVYEVIVSPILTKKCNSCHNPSKAKGDLVMTASSGIIAGGKNGTIFDLKDHKQGAFFRMTHLPLGDDDHMPPKGKSQLSDDELAILDWWIENDACMNCLVSELKNSASMDPILKKYQAPLPANNYAHIEALDDESIESLGRNMLISKVSDGHPMVVINLSYRQDLDEQKMDKVSDIAENVLELNLAGSNFSDDLGSYLTQFKNLKKVQLQKTKVTDKTIESLKELQFLESLNIYETRVSGASSEHFKALPSLRNLYAWNAKITEVEAIQLMEEKPLLSVSYKIDDEIFGENVLGPPQIIVEEEIFVGSTLVELKSNLSGVDIFYTMDGSDPDSTDVKYTKPLEISETALIKAVALKGGWGISDPTEQQLMQIKVVPSEARVLPAPNRKYAAKGGATLIDAKKGSKQFTDGLWLGFEGTGATSTMRLDQPTGLKKITVSALSEQGNWIFFPKAIKVSYSLDDKNYVHAGQLDIPLEEPGALISDIEYFEVPVDIHKAIYVKVEIDSHLKNPDWHPNPGGKSWIFIDEILFN